MKTDFQTDFNAPSEIVSAPETGSSPDSSVRLWAFSIILVVGVVRVWVGRYSMNPDGICYLDLGDTFFHRKWFDAVNGYWSPLYAWLLGAALSLIKPSRWWEFPVVHAVNFVIYLATFVCFEFFLRSLCRELRGPGDFGWNMRALSERALLAIGYALFLWTSLEVITIWDLSPDLCLAALVYLIAGLLLQIRRQSSPQLYVTLGLVLGFAYLTKAVMFPLSLAFILIGLYCVPRRERLQYLLLVTFTFLAIASPWLAALSRAKGRFDFGDSGRLNYSALVSPGGRLLNWQGGDPPGSGVPVHTTRKIHDNPPVYEFATPVGGTYPPSYDPSYWNEGREWTFSMRTQFSVLKEHLLLYAGLLLRDQPGLLAGVLVLLLAGGVAMRRALLQSWPLFAMFVAATGLYALVHVETRFVGAYVAIFWLAILISVRLPIQENRKMADYLALAMVVTLLLSVADGTLHAVSAGGPYSAPNQITVADGLQNMGLHAGDHVAILGDGNWAYWARLGKLKIVSTVMSRDLPAFWGETSDQKQEIYQLLASTGARAVVSAQVPASDVGNGWIQIGTTEYYLRWLLSSSSKVEPSAVTN